ncbi:uncharacterized protein SAPINGB_P001001 [Magnusiomyces paraingens]|uniref:Cytochrome P450 n=1 Tax=Magnusiomyces paraingens TaxID=2606893 RepID=A0A5E8B9N8_9ASCO|nr:uncharacterized protein SAPINGB_P001001 [Saprochaete ingens]VVT46009.1 unnamed protein product [Saprochaete ingens]
MIPACCLNTPLNSFPKHVSLIPASLVRIAVCYSIPVFLVWKLVLRPTLNIRTFSQTSPTFRAILKLLLTCPSPLFLFITFTLLLLIPWAYLALDLISNIYCTQKVIKNIPVFDGFSPGPKILPLIGNLFQLGPSAPLTYWTWKYPSSTDPLLSTAITTPHNTQTAYLADPRVVASLVTGTPITGPQPTPIFQLRLGARRVVVVNSYAAARRLWATHWARNCSRPVLHTFHAVLAAQGQGTTIGTTPYGPDWRRMKSVAARALNAPAVAAYMPIIERESSACLVRVAKAVILMAKDGCSEIDLSPFFETYALKVSLAVAYGVPPKDDDGILQEIIDVEKQINKIRAALHSLEDYVPLTRVAGGIGELVKRTLNTLNPSIKAGVAPIDRETVLSVRARRAKYMDTLMARLRQGLADKDNSYPTCILGSVLKGTPALTPSQLQSVCLTMVSAGLDTIPVNIVSAIGHLATKYGQRIQAEVYTEIQAMWAKRGGAHVMWAAWGIASLNTQYEPLNADEEIEEYRSALPYLTALLWESMRHTSAQPINLARETVAPIDDFTEDADGNSVPIHIEAGTMLVMNTLAANFDSTRFPDPFRFSPERYLECIEGGSDNEEKKVMLKWRIRAQEGTGLPHMSFGAGSRICAGSRLAEREMYVALMKIIACFHVSPPVDTRNEMETNVWTRFKAVDSLVVEPPAFRVRLAVREEARKFLKELMI